HSAWGAARESVSVMMMGPRSKGLAPGSEPVTQRIERHRRNQRRPAQRRTARETRHRHSRERLKCLSLAANRVAQDLAGIRSKQYSKPGKATGVVKPRGDFAD